MLNRKFDSKNLGLLKQKGAYPYKYMNSFDVNDYLTCKKTWDKFEMK